MINNAYHICCGEAAYGCLKERNRLLGAASHIIMLLDDFRVGNLIDADSANPKLRFELLEEIWSSQWWYNEMEYKDSLFWHWYNHHNNLLKALSDTRPKIVWIGNNACNKLMLAMVASLTNRSAPLMMVDITGRVTEHHNDEFDISFCAPESLLELNPQVIPLSDKAVLTELWKHWKNNGKGWRQIDENGNITEHPIDFIDKIILEKLNYKEEKTSMELIGDIISQSPNYIPPHILYWRLVKIR